jgi:hypothetical protein
MLTEKQLIPLTYKIPNTTHVITAATYIDPPTCSTVGRWRICNLDMDEMHNETGKFEQQTFEQKTDPISAYTWMAYHSFPTITDAIEFYNLLQL